jgi:hypothetical protein
MCTEPFAGRHRLFPQKLPRAIFRGKGEGLNSEVKVVDTRPCNFGNFPILELSRHYSVVRLCAANLEF